MIVLRYLTVVFQSLFARGLLMSSAEGYVTDFQQLRSREERHIGGIVVDRIDDATLVDSHCLEAGTLGFNCAGEPSGTGANHQYIYPRIRVSRSLGAGKRVRNLFGQSGNFFAYQMIVPRAETSKWSRVAQAQTFAL